MYKLKKFLPEGRHSVYNTIGGSVVHKTMYTIHCGVLSNEIM